MKSRVTIRNRCTGIDYVFESREVCFIGRANDCRIQILGERRHGYVSRYHCLLDIVPPRIRIRDFGSLNGTYVNGTQLGPGKHNDAKGNTAQSEFGECDLVDGDEFRVGTELFGVLVATIHDCPGCQKEIPVSQSDDVSTMDRWCDNCKSSQVPETLPIATAPDLTPRCKKCGYELPVVSGNNTGEVCTRCKTAPGELSTGADGPPSIGGCKVVAQIGRGGSGTVFLARHPEDDRDLAIKTLRRVADAPHIAIERFQREIVITATLHHPNLVRLFDFGIDHGLFYFTMEYCQGGTFADLVRRNRRPMSVDESANIILQVLDGLSYAHRIGHSNVPLAGIRAGAGNGIVHRDIKPGNIFLVPDNGSTIAKLGDFGLSKAFDLAGLSGHTVTGAVGGTPAFMSRHQVRNFKYSNPAVDVWAVAACWYYSLTLRFVRDFRDTKDPWQTILQEDTVPILNRNARIPPAVARVIDAALLERDEPAYSTATELADAIRGVL